jgi:DNA-binding MarR family transcriptional regulator
MRNICIISYMSEMNLPMQLRRVRKALLREFEARAAALDITVPQFQVLYRLWHGDGALTSVIVKDICTSGATMTGVLDRLESKGLIERRPSPQDRRATQIWLTPAGLALNERLMKIMQAIEKKALVGFSAAQKKKFRQDLEKVGRNLES